MADCNLGGIFCTVIATARRNDGDPIKPTYYIEAWIVLPLVIVVFFAGRLSRRKG